MWRAQILCDPITVVIHCLPLQIEWVGLCRAFQHNFISVLLYEDCGSSEQAASSIVLESFLSFCQQGAYQTDKMPSIVKNIVPSAAS